MARRRLAVLADVQEPGALNLCRAFREAGHEVTFLNRGPRPAAEDEVADLAKASATVDLYAPGRYRDDRAFATLNGLGHRAASAGLGGIAAPWLQRSFDAQLARPVRERVAAAVRQAGAEVVYSFWGVATLPELRALQLANAEAALVHHFQTYPLGKALQARPRPASPLEAATLGRLEGRIHASEEMEHYLDAALRPPRGVDQILPDAWGAWACAGRQRLPRLRDSDGVPHVVHMGAPPARPGGYDDVRDQLDAMALSGLAVHAAEGFAGPRIRTFPRMGLRALLTGEVATFMTPFDALVMPLNAPPGLQWFAGNLPARFLSGVSAGIPVAVPRGRYGAVQRFVEREGNGLVYEGAEDLATKLRDEGRMSEARKAAEALEREHRLDRFLPRYEAFLDLALDHRAGRGPGASATLK